MKWTTCQKVANAQNTLKSSTDHLNRPVTGEEIELVMLKLFTEKIPGPDGFTGEFNQIFKENQRQFFTNSSKQ